jgi:sterol O-acyltransferase
MSSSTDAGAANGHANHEHILRPRAIKPGNPAALRMSRSSESNLLAVSKESGNQSGQTR